MCVHVRKEKLFLVGVVNWLKWAEVCSLHLTLIPDTKRGEAFFFSQTQTEVPEIFGNVPPEKNMFSFRAEASRF